MFEPHDLSTQQIARDRKLIIKLRSVSRSVYFCQAIPFTGAQISAELDIDLFWTETETEN